MEESQLVNDIKSLPPEAQKQILDFVSFIKSCYSTDPSLKKRKTNLAKEPFLGMWSDRQEMKDSTEYVRNMRRTEWNPKS